MRNLILLACLILMACASNSYGLREGHDYGYMEDSRSVWVRGPWEVIRPSRDIDEVIDQLCPAIMRLPVARMGDFGQEYCGVIYPIEDGLYYASAPSPLKRVDLVGDSKHKSCFVPYAVRDFRSPRPRPAADFHSHPWSNSPMSNEDRRKGRQRYHMRIQFDANCRVQKLLPHVDENQPDEVHERRSGGWTLVGYILPEDKKSGMVTLVRD